MRLICNTKGLEQLRMSLMCSEVLEYGSAPVRNLIWMAACLVELRSITNETHSRAGLGI